MTAAEIARGLTPVQKRLLSYLAQHGECRWSVSKALKFGLFEGRPAVTCSWITINPLRRDQLIVLRTDNERRAFIAPAIRALLEREAHD